MGHGLRDSIQGLLLNSTVKHADNRNSIELTLVQYQSLAILCIFHTISIRMQVGPSMPMRLY